MFPITRSVNLVIRITIKCPQVNRRVCDRLASEYRRPTQNEGANRAGPRLTLVAVAPSMTTDTPRAGKSAGADTTVVQREVECQDCEYLETYCGSQADGHALNDAMHHAGDTGHEVIAEHTRRNVRVHGALPDGVDADV